MIQDFEKLYNLDINNSDCRKSINKKYSSNKNYECKFYKNNNNYYLEILSDIKIPKILKEIL
jgi:hypothetical protein